VRWLGPPNHRTLYLLFLKITSGHLVVHTHVEVHAKDLLIGQMIAALTFDGVAVLIDDRVLERMQCTGLDRGLSIHRRLFHVVRHIGVRSHNDER
jgi:hypothetical protein